MCRSRRLAYLSEPPCSILWIHAGGLACACMYASASGGKGRQGVGGRGGVRRLSEQMHVRQCLAGKGAVHLYLPETLRQRSALSGQTHACIRDHHQLPTSPWHTNDIHHSACSLLWLCTVYYPVAGEWWLVKHCRMFRLVLPSPTLCTTDRYPVAAPVHCMPAAALPWMVDLVQQGQGDTRSLDDAGTSERGCVPQ
jgi:hypothetical protein